MTAANPTLDTASQRPATGMDTAARQLIRNTLGRLFGSDDGDRVPTGQLPNH